MASKNPLGSFFIFGRKDMDADTLDRLMTKQPTSSLGEAEEVAEFVLWAGQPQVVVC
jgi:hypothetical protein